MTHATKEAAAVRAETGATWPVGAKQEDFLRLPQSGCGLNDELHAGEEARTGPLRREQQAQGPREPRVAEAKGTRASIVPDGTRGVCGRQTA